MKKYKLFIGLSIVIALYVVLTWIVPGSQFGSTDGAELYRAGLIDLITVPFVVPGYFANILIFILVAGGFNGVLQATGVYDKTVTFFKNKFKGKELVFVISTLSLIAVITSLSGIGLGLLFLFPVLISTIVELGYSKLTALTATFGATIVGMFGATFASTMYLANATLNLTIKSDMLTKVIMFVLGLGLLILFVIFFNKRESVEEEKPSKAKKGSKVIKEEKAVEESKKSVWPLIVTLGLLVVIFILGTVEWGSIFKTNWFDKAYDSVMGVKIFGFELFSNLFKGIPPFGSWVETFDSLSNIPRFQYYSVFLIIASLILILIYRIKFIDGIKEFFKGVQDYIVPAVLTGLAYSLVLFVAFYPSFNFIATKLLGSSEYFNAATYGLFTIFASILHPDFYFFMLYLLDNLKDIAGDAKLYPLVSIMTTSLFSIVMMFSPTSVLLINSLSIADVSYKDWLKHIWKLLVSLLVIAFMVFGIIILT